MKKGIISTLAGITFLALAFTVWPTLWASILFGLGGLMFLGAGIEEIWVYLKQRNPARGKEER